MKLTDNAVPVEERIAHVKVLAADPRPAALEELLSGLDVMSEDLRDAIVAALEKRNAGAVVLERAADPKRPTVERVHALLGVRTLKPKNAAPALAPLLDPTKVKDELVREAAAHALCVVDAGAAEAALIASITKDPSSKVRYYAAIALGELKSPAAKRAVSAQLKVEKDFLVLDSLERSARKHANP